MTQLDFGLLGILCRLGAGASGVLTGPNAGHTSGVNASVPTDQLALFDLDSAATYEEQAA